MQRVVLERSVCDGFRTSKVEAVVNTGGGRKIFVGTGEGAIMLYECKQEMSSVGRVYSCKLAETLRKPSKEKKAASMLTCVESWRVLIGLVEGVIVAYDSQFYQLLGSIVDNKGCHLYAVNEATTMLVAVNKKRLSQYVWQYPGFGLRKEINLVDTPKSLAYIGEHVVIGYKKFYESINMATGITSRIIDFDKEHKTFIQQIPANHLRGDTLLLTLGNQGVVLPLEKVLQGEAIAHGGLSPHSSSSESIRIEWSASPVSISIMKPFLLTVLMDSSVEVHNLSNFLPLQKISIACPSPNILSVSICQDDSTASMLVGNTGGGGSGGNSGGYFGMGNDFTSFAFHSYVCNGEQLSVVKMIPLTTQVEELVNAGLFEEAINLTKLCGYVENNLSTSSIDLISLYKSSALVFLSKGDYEKAIQHFIFAKCEFVEIMKYFPDFIPSSLQSVWRMSTTSSSSTNSSSSSSAESTPKPLTDMALVRAANAVIQLCEHFKAMNAQLMVHKMSGYNSLSSSSTPSIDQELQLLDTMYLHALLHSNLVTKKSLILHLVSQPNQCHVDSCAYVLATIGKTAYIEALLWLYRSQRQHTRILSMLTEDKCVVNGGMGRDQFYHWMADYLHFLWYQDEDPSLPKQALPVLASLFQLYDAELALFVLLSRPLHKAHTGGKSVSLSEILTFFQPLFPMIHPYHIDLWGYGTNTGNHTGHHTGNSTGNNTGNSTYTSSTGNSHTNTGNTTYHTGITSTHTGNTGISNQFTFSYQKDNFLEKSLKKIISSVPLFNGFAIGIVYLECLISLPEAMPQMYDEYVEYLFTGIQDLLTGNSSNGIGNGNGITGNGGNGNGGNGNGNTGNGNGNTGNTTRDTIMTLPMHYTLPYHAVSVHTGKDTPVIRQYKIYRSKLQSFLQHPTFPYHPQLLLRLLPPDFQYEYALVLSKLGKHLDVLYLCIYVLGSIPLAELYCDSMYRVMVTGGQKESMGGGGGCGGKQGTSFSGIPPLPTATTATTTTTTASHSIATQSTATRDVTLTTVRFPINTIGLFRPGDAYLLLFQVILEDKAGKSTPEERIARMLALAAKHFDKFNTNAFLSLLPSSVTLAHLLPYLLKVLEFQHTKKRNLQIIDQLLRKREVDLRANQILLVQQKQDQLLADTATAGTLTK